MDQIDLLVSVAGVNNDAIDQYLPLFLVSLNECSLDRVNIFLVTRDCLPVSKELSSLLEKSGYTVISCPLHRFNTVLEDTSVVCNWMMDNCGDAPWAIVSHFDVMFCGDYVGYLRTLMPDVSMIGNHHDGVVAINREAYRKCGVGFYGVDNLKVITNSAFEYHIVPKFPHERNDRLGFCLSLDVGELLALRMATLGFNQVLLRRKADFNDIGKSDYFTHYRDGSSQKKRSSWFKLRAM